MTDKVIVYTRASDGGVSICMPAEADRRPRESEEAWFRRAIDRSLPKDALDIKVIDRKSLPEQHRTFRNAWVHSAGRVDVDMTKAREIHRYRIRRKRKARFRELDAQQLRAMEAGDTATLASIAAAKKKLRDAPAYPDIDAAQTPDELKAAWPL